MNPVAAPPRVAIESLVEKLRALPRSAFDETEQVRSLLEQMPVDEASLAPYLTWDPPALHPQPHRQDRTLRTPRHLLGGGPVQFGAQSPRPELLDGRAQSESCWSRIFTSRFQDLEAGKCRLRASNTVELSAAESLRGRSPGACTPRRESARSESTRRDFARLFASLRYLRRLFAGAGNLRGYRASLQHGIR
jgi:hypothetical protein